MAAELNLGALLLALSAGLLASAWTRDWLKSVATAEALSFVFAMVFMISQCVVLDRLLAGAGGVCALPGNPGGAPGARTHPFASIAYRVSRYYGEGTLSVLAVLLARNTNLESDVRTWINTPRGAVQVGGLSTWSEVWTGYPPPVHRTWIAESGGIVLLCFLFVSLALALAGRSVEHGLREMPPSPQRQRVNELLSRSMVSSEFMRRRTRRGLERNPIGWLQQYSRSARLTKWGWCGFVVIGELVFASNWRDAWDAQYWVAGLLLLGLSFSASGSFHRERETGATELLLVTPLQASQIIQGRLAGIRLQFLPSFATLLLAWVFLLQPAWLRNLLQPQEWEGPFAEFVGLLGFTAVSHLTLPTIGLFFSMRSLHQVVSWLCTCAVGLLVPALILANPNFVAGILGRFGFPMQWLMPPQMHTSPMMVAAFAWQFSSALVTRILLGRSLAKRRFIETVR